MKRFRETTRTVGTMFGLGYRAAPAWMVGSLLLVSAGGLAVIGPSVGFRLLVDGVVDDDEAKAITAAILIAVLSSVMWVAGIIGATTSGALADRVRLFVSARMGELAHAVPGVEHFERPDYLRELELLEENRNLIGAGPQQCVYLVQSVLQLTATVLLLATVHPLLALLPALGAIPFWAQARSVKLRQRSEEQLAEQRRLANELFALTAKAGSAKELRVFGLSGELHRRHGVAADKAATATIQVAMRGAVLATAGWLVFGAGLFGGLLLVLHEAAEGRATAGEVLMAVGLAQLTHFQLTNVSSTVGQLLTTAQTVRRYLWLEDYATAAMPPVQGETQAVPEHLHVGVALDHVSFRYPGTDVDVLDDVTLTIPAGATVALVGENGAGKTTLVKLLAGMYTPTSGEVAIDGVPLREFDVGAWRRRMSAAFQDFVRFELVAHETVGVGDVDRIDDTDAVLGALDAAGAEDVLDGFSDGLATRLGQSFAGGRDLSGGQWQKLALGRAMMRDEPLLLVLDEPTSSLDAVTESALFQRYERAARSARAQTGAITVLVSHRFSTVRMADVIVVLDRGRVVESGSHTELIAAGGLYAELFELQATPYR